MPLPILWTFFHCTEDGCLYLKVGDVDVRKNYGAILAVRYYGDRNTSVKVSPTATIYDMAITTSNMSN